MADLFKLQNGDYLISEGDILTKNEMCEALGISVSTLHRWMRKGMPFTQFSNQKNGYVLAEINQWIKETGRVPIDINKQWKARKAGTTQ